MDIEDFSNKVFKALGIIFILAACVFAGWLSFHTGNPAHALLRGVSMALGTGLMFAGVLIGNFFKQAEMPSTGALIMVAVSVVGMALMFWPLFGPILT